MRRLAAVVALALASIALAGAPAHADNAPCASKPEFAKVHKGQKPSRVADIFGTRGKLRSSFSSGGYRSIVREYPTCDRDSYVEVQFSAEPGEALRVIGKSAFWA